MSKLSSAPLVGFKSSQGFAAYDPSRSQLVRVLGEDVAQAAVAEIIDSGAVLFTVDTLADAVAGDYSSGQYLMTGGEVAVLDGGTSLYRVSDPGSGGVVMDNGNELVALIVSIIEAAELTAQAAVSADEAAASEAAAASDAAQVAIDTALAQTAASEAATSAATYDNFDQLYLGSKSTAPTQDNEGNALISGTEYFNTTSNAKFTWNGSAWVATNAAGLGTASLVDYSEYSSTLDGQFTEGTFTAIKIGRVVTIELSMSEFPVASEAGTGAVIPTEYRPPESDDVLDPIGVRSNIGNIRGGIATKLEVNSDGNITLSFYNVDGGSSSVGDADSQTITYLTA